MNSLLFFNGEIHAANEALVSANNRGLRYGDGLFETIKVVNNQIPLLPLHLERLTKGLEILQMSLPDGYNPEFIQQSILTVCQRNQVSQAARVRLTVFRGNGTLYSVDEHHPSVVIQADPLTGSYLSLNETGWSIDVFPDVQKSCDVLANLKSNNYLPYILAAMYAQRNHLNDCLVLNAHQRICDATIANIFWVRDNRVHTPPLTEGCVAGVMRRHLLQNYPVLETPCTENELLQADELFLTNALYGIRWVHRFREKLYNNQIVSELYERFVPR